jgi:LmbE family N-acetylglucosaminyl deacetylase
MPTENHEAPPAALFLFAHQDDEFGVFQQIDAYVRAKHMVFCVYVTDGGATACPKRRNKESSAVLEAMGVPAANVFFIGTELGVCDGHLHEHTKVVADWLTKFVSAHPEIGRCFVPAWEGGHPDHDMLHALATCLMHERGQLHQMHQFPLYHGRNCPPPLFRVMSPLPENGPIETFQIAWRDRFRYLRYCIGYPSQWQTWLVLFPFVFFHYVVRGVQFLQPVNAERLNNHPHKGRLYYEARGFLTWEKMSAKLAGWRSER